MSKKKYKLEDLARAIGAVEPDSEASFDNISTDTRKIQPGDVFFALSGEKFDANDFLPDAFARGACAAVVKRPDSAGPCLVVPDVQRALQQFAAHHRNQFTIPIFALTGSCGKTTTKDMTAAVLGTRYNVLKTQGNLNNEIGCPLTLLRIDDTTGFAVVEMGANHPGEIARLCEIARPTESAITIVAPAHLEGFGTVENVARAKGEIMRGLHEGGVFYVNADDPWCVNIAQDYSGEKVYFGREGDVVLEKCELLAPGRMRLNIKPVGEMELPLACPAHATSVLLAVAVGLRHGVTEFEAPLQAACVGTSRFKLLQIGPLTVIDDSYNANPASVGAALDALAAWPGNGGGPARKMAALGEMLELGETAGALHRQVGERAGQSGLAFLVAKGPHACDTIQAARAAGVEHAEVQEDPQQIADAVSRFAQPGDVLLVKGSRGMQMERVIEALQSIYG